MSSTTSGRPSASTSATAIEAPAFSQGNQSGTGLNGVCMGHRSGPGGRSGNPTAEPVRAATAERPLPTEPDAATAPGPPGPAVRLHLRLRLVSGERSEPATEVLDASGSKACNDSPARSPSGHRVDVRLSRRQPSMLPIGAGRRRATGRRRAAPSAARSPAGPAPPAAARCTGRLDQPAEDVGIRAGGGEEPGRRRVRGGWARDPRAARPSPRPAAGPPAPGSGSTARPRGRCARATPARTSRARRGGAATTCRSTCACSMPTLRPRPADGFVQAHASPTAAKPVTTGRPSTT